MQSSTQQRESMAAVPNNSIVKSAITSWHGKQMFYCRQCGEKVPVAFHYKGTGPSPFTGETIYWDWIEDELGHTLEDLSH